MRVYCYNTDRSGCYWYRLFTPYTKIKENCPDTFDFTFCPRTVEEIAEYDIVVLQRATDALGLEMAEYARARGIPVIYEIDDSLFNIAEVNPAHTHYAREDVRFCLVETLNRCDFMSVSTQPLKEYYSEYLAPDCIHVLPNSVSLSQKPGFFNIPKNGGYRKDYTKLQVLITGGISHKGDWGLVANVFRDLVYETKGKILFTAFGYFPDDFKNIPNLRVVSPVPVQEYYKVLSNIDFDVMVAPLEDIEFNSYKSNLKFVEAGSLKKALIGSDVKAYNVDIQDGVNGWLLKNNWYHWGKLLKRLTNNVEEVKAAGQRAYETVAESYDLDRTWMQWAQFYNDIACKFGNNKNLIRIDHAN